jgi:hypothetical protein
MSQEFTVTNEVELGNAIWASSEGDTIILQSGEYGNIPTKKGVTYKFPADQSATAASILGLPMSIVGKWSAGRFEGEHFKVENPNIDPSVLKSFYVFQKLLPFNIRFKEPISFMHSNGSILTFIDNISINSNTGEATLPRGIVRITVPDILEVEFDKADNSYLYNLYRKNNRPCSVEETEEHKKAVDFKEEVEERKINQSFGLNLSNQEYKALWALNHFIRQYAKITNDKRIKGYSIPEFLDNLLRSEFNNSNPKELGHQNFITYTNINLDNSSINQLAQGFMSAPDYSLFDYIQYNLELLNYSFAIVGMYQLWEKEWETWKNSSENPNSSKWDFIESKTSDLTMKKNLSELINARNNIIHRHQLITGNFLPRNRLKTEWSAEEYNEYQIFSNKKPWIWFNKLKEFLT